MRRLLVACLLLGACTAPEASVSTSAQGTIGAAAGGGNVGKRPLPLAALPWAVPDPDPGGVILGGVDSKPPQEPPTTAPEPTTTATEPPRPPVTAASRSRGAPNCGGWLDLVASYDWPVDTACRILLCESGGDPDARNPSGATGLMQIMGGPTDPADNMAVAYDMWRHRGFQPWVCR